MPNNVTGSTYNYSYNAMCRQTGLIDRYCGTAGSRLLGIFLSVLICGMAGCSSFCRNTSVAKRSSPDGHFVAVVFYRDYGATTQFTTEISIVRATGDPISQGAHGNVFSMADPDNGSNKSLEHNGAIEVRLDWKTPQLLSISTPRLARVDRRVDHIENIRIAYSTFD